MLAWAAPNAGVGTTYDRLDDRSFGTPANRGTLTRMAHDAPGKSFNAGQIADIQLRCGNFTNLPNGYAGVELEAGVPVATASLAQMSYLYFGAAADLGMAPSTAALSSSVGIPCWVMEVAAHSCRALEAPPAIPTLASSFRIRSAIVSIARIRPTACGSGARCATGPR